MACCGFLIIVLFVLGFIYYPKVTGIALVIFIILGYYGSKLKQEEEKKDQDDLEEIKKALKRDGHL